MASRLIVFNILKISGCEPLKILIYYQSEYLLIPGLTRKLLQWDDEKIF